MEFANVQKLLVAVIDYRYYLLCILYFHFTAICTTNVLANVHNTQINWQNIKIDKVHDRLPIRKLLSFSFFLRLIINDFAHLRFDKTNDVGC